MITKPLGEIADILISNVDKKSKDNEKEVKLCNFVDVYYNWAITANNEKDFMIATASDTAIDKFTLHKGDVAITKDSETRNDIGVATYISEELDNVLLGYHCILIHPNEEIVLGKYLNVVLHSSYAQKYFEANASGSGQRYTLTDTLVKEMPIPLPDINIQRKIGDIPSYIDRKIENNNKVNAELESMAKTIYDYWFLQFEFPNEDGKPYKSSGGKMVWNEELKREIPEGWEVQSIFQCMDTTYGLPLSTDSFTENEGIPVIRIRDILENTISAYTTENVEERYLTEEKDLLIGMDGNFHMNFWAKKGDCVNQRIFRIRDKDKVSALQIYYEIAPVIKAREANVARSTVGHLSDKDFKSMNILISNNETIHTTFTMLLDEICKNKKENQELTSLRDFLLPMLMNGQVGFKINNRKE